MSSSQNSGSTHSKQLETKTFDKYGMTFMYHIATTYPEEWVPHMITGTEGTPVRQEWQRTGEILKVAEVIDAVLKDDDRCQVARPIYLYSTADGPILAIALRNSPESIELLDPCIVVYNGKSQLDLVPIFGVSRVLTLARTALRSWQPPNELLLAAYPRFLIQNRMYKYQLRPLVPFATTPELTNDGS